MDPIFSPPLHKQRHQFVIDFIKKNKTKKVVDLGCSECTLMKKLRFHREIEHLVGMDINGAKVKKRMHSLAPISTDYLQPGYDQLHVELFQGSVTERDARFRGFDLAVSIELIEHLTLPDVERFSDVLFGYMAPVYVIVSTPNSDFNPLLPGLTGFRHHDHKFEWTRAEFKSWTRKVCEEFEYEVDITGVGQAPNRQQDTFGFCSQIAVFHRLKGGYNVLSEERRQLSYTLLYSVKYPSLRDNNVLRRILVCEVLFWAETLKKRWAESKNMRADEKDTEDENDSEDTEERGDMKLKTRHSSVCEEKSPLVDEWRGTAGDGEELKVWSYTNGTTENKNGASQRYVVVPLSQLWSCPKVRSLSGSLPNLRHFLTYEPLVKLSQDGSALLLQDSDEDEEYDRDLEDSGFTETRQTQTNTEQEENWTVPPKHEQQENLTVAFKHEEQKNLTVIYKHEQENWTVPLKHDQKENWDKESES